MIKTQISDWRRNVARLTEDMFHNETYFCTANKKIRFRMKQNALYFYQVNVLISESTRVLSSTSMVKGRQTLSM